MKRVIFFFLLGVSTVMWSQQTDVFWNSLLPNGMDLNYSDGSSLLRIIYNAGLGSLSGIVATAYKGDTLFATDGQILYLIVGDTVHSQFNLNNQKAGRDQAFIVTLNSLERRIVKVITDIGDTVKIFTWPDMSNPEILSTSAEPVIEVRSWFNPTAESTLEVLYLENGKVKIYSQTLRTDSLTLPKIEEYDISYQSPVEMVRYDDNLLVLEDKDSTLIYYKQQKDMDSLGNFSYSYSFVHSYPWKARDIYVRGWVFYGTDTAVVLADYDGTSRTVYYQKSYQLPTGFQFKQFIPNAFGQLLIYPAQPDSLYAIYNFTHDPMYFLLRSTGDYLGSVYPGDMNIVRGYYPMYFFDTWGEYGLGCQQINVSLLFSQSTPNPIDGVNVSLPEPGKIVKIQDTASLTRIYYETSFFVHNGDTSATVSTYLFGFKPAFRVDYNYDSTYTISVSVKYLDNSMMDLVPNNGITWYRDGYVIDSGSSVQVTEIGPYAMEVSDSVCTYDTVFYVTRSVDFLESIKDNVPTITANSYPTYLYSYLVGDSLNFKVMIDENSQYEGVDLNRDFRFLYLFDGQVVGSDTESFWIKIPYSGKHLFSILYLPKDSLSSNSLAVYNLPLYIYAPRLKVILPRRQYALGDTAHFYVSTDSSRADIYFKPEFSILPYVSFRKVDDNLWEADVNSPYAQGKTLTSPDSLSLFILLAANNMDKLKMKLIAPDGREVEFYSGFASNSPTRYIIGNPYCAKYSPDARYFSVTNDTVVALGMYPLLFSSRVEDQITEKDFNQQAYSDCAIDGIDAMVYNSNRNEVNADFTALEGAPINGTWQLVVETMGNDSDIISLQPYLMLPAGATSFNFFNDTGEVSLNVKKTAQFDFDMIESLDDSTFVMKSKGEDSLKFILTFDIQGFALLGQMPNVDEELHKASVAFDIIIKKQAVYYDDKTYTFSPNGDGINDFWNPLTTIATTFPVLKDAPLDQLRVVIVNTEGVAVKSFLMSDSPQGWDGTDRNGKPVNPGLYWYFVIYRDQKYYGTMLLMK